MHRRSPRSVSSALEALTARLAPQSTLAEIQARWRDAVGPTIADRAWPVAERAGVLTIACESSLWAQELDLMSDAIAERLNERLRGGEIVRLRCTAAYPGKAGYRGS